MANYPCKVPEMDYCMYMLVCLINFSNSTMSRFELYEKLPRIELEPSIYLLSYADNFLDQLFNNHVASISIGNTSNFSKKKEKD